MRALIFRASGKVGRAVALRLAHAALRLVATTRGGRALPAELGQAGVSHQSSDLATRADIVRVTGGTFDLIVDANTYLEADGRNLMAIESSAAAFVVVSSVSVCTDSKSRTLNDAATTGFPELEGPIDEATPTVPAGDENYSRRKIAMENAIRQSWWPVAVLRPCAIYGAWGRHFREWWFIRLALTQKRAIPVAYDGQSRFHTTSLATLAETVACIGDAPVSDVINVTDRDSPAVSEIAMAIESAIDMPLPLQTFSGDPIGPDLVGSTPWSTPRLFILDTRRLTTLLGGSPSHYSDAVLGPCRWALRHFKTSDGDESFSTTKAYYQNLPAYDAEDSALGSLASKQN